MVLTDYHFLKDIFYTIIMYYLQKKKKKKKEMIKPSKGKTFGPLHQTPGSLFPHENRN